ncbi:MAG: DUF1697 domain-containing protein [Candidatus Peribacteraceae bacterium]|nr:DUF1697 domain-containing protein [Candidatus Peribacteraceae bacterium]
MPSKNSTIRFVAFLRGINVGGNKIIPMAKLKTMFELLGFTNVKTLLATGNILFDASETKPEKLVTLIEKKIEATFDLHSHAIVRTLDNLQKLIDREPFKKIKVTPEKRLYITFLAAKPTSKLVIPYRSPTNDFEILSVSDTEICSVLTLNPKTRSVDAMQILEKEYGKNVTTRNWNTVMKLVR